jgi:hypothetical protein
MNTASAAFLMKYATGEKGWEVRDARKETEREGEKRGKEEAKGRVERGTNEEYSKGSSKTNTTNGSDDDRRRRIEIILLRDAIENC